jgi:hypothetical protein
VGSTPLQLDRSNRCWWMGGSIIDPLYIHSSHARHTGVRSFSSSNFRKLSQTTAATKKKHCQGKTSSFFSLLLQLTGTTSSISNKSTRILLLLALFVRRQVLWSVWSIPTAVRTKQDHFAGNQSKNANAFKTDN